MEHKPIKIKFGTDGWRAVIAENYTLDNLTRVAEGTAKWLLSTNGKKCVVGYDCRFAGQMFASRTAEVLSAFGIEVIVAPSFVSTPVVSYSVTELKADLGIVITASHNPPLYNGFKLKSKHGGPAIPSQIAEVEALIPDFPEFITNRMQADDNLIAEVDLEKLYLDKVNSSFDLDSIRNADFNVCYDAMYGAGQAVLPKILPDAFLMHCEHNQGFNGQAPEPIERNLVEQKEFITQNAPNYCGLSTDGDADRIGMFDEKGVFVDSHNILLLLLYYLFKEKGYTGKVVVTFSVTDKMKKLAQLFGLDIQVTKIGFKYIAEIMLQDDVLVGGEESGGLAIKGFIPERDGIWIGLTIMEFMAKSGKKLYELVEMIHELVGEFHFDRDDLHIPNEQKWGIIERCKQVVTSIGELKVTLTEDIDGYKFYFENEGEWVMIRPSGTEPVLRVYAQAQTTERVRYILDTTHAHFKQ